MKQYFLRSKLLFLSLLLFSLANFSFADERSTPEQAKAMVKRAIDFYKENGKQKSFAEFNDLKGRFVKGDLYLFAFNTAGDGIQLVHGNNPKMIGKNVLDMRDPDGKFIVRSFLQVVNSKEGAGWVEYKWTNPLTHSIENKISYVERVGDIFIGCGAYKKNEKN